MHYIGSCVVKVIKIKLGDRNKEVKKNSKVYDTEESFIQLDKRDIDEKSFALRSGEIQYELYFHCQVPTSTKNSLMEGPITSKWPKKHKIKKSETKDFTK